MSRPAATGPGPAPGPTETLARRSAECVWLDRFALRVIDGPDRGALAISPGARMVIGTDEACDFRLTDRAMSRFHCEVVLEKDTVMVRDLDSTNGTRIDGVRIAAAYLRRGARLELGRNLMRFDMAGEQVGVDLHPADRFGDLRGGSVAMRAVFASLARAAASATTVLLSGETGTGKDLAASSIHLASARADGPFVVVDCGAIAAGLHASELFGHVRGAFTGAVADRIGAFEAARGGTLFLDEIGELPVALQPVLLRVLERREVQRVGETRRRPVDVRIIAATNRDLQRAVNTGRFRADLYYRLAVLPVRLPPLRERREDIPLLVDGFVEQLGQGDPALAARLRQRLSLDELARHDWPGNVRELRNHLERCAVLEQPEQVAGSDAPAASGAPSPGAGQPLRLARERWNRWFERQYAEDLLRRSGNNVAAAARAAQVDRAYLYRLLGRVGLRG